MSNKSSYCRLSIYFFYFDDFIKFKERPFIRQPLSPANHFHSVTDLNVVIY